MSSIKTGSHTHAATNRLADVFQMLDQGLPLAARLGESSTAGRISFTSDPRSTWGYNPLGPSRRPVRSTYCSTDYVAIAVTAITEKAYRVIGGNDAKDTKSRFEKGFSRDEARSGTLARLLDVHEQIQANNLMGCILGESMSPIERTEPVVAVNLSDYLDPPSFDWTESDTRAAEAARAFGEGVYADH